MDCAQKTYTPRYLVDLHSHTNRSDGAETPQELIDHAASVGMRILALTDHDIRPPETIRLDSGEEADILAYAAERQLILLRGTEISCETAVEDCHIVCLGCEWNDPYFGEMEQFVKGSKTDSYRELVRRLAANGMPVTWEEVLENGGYPVPEDRVQKKMIFELLARRGFSKNWSTAKIMVKSTPALQVRREKPDPKVVLEAVHRTGGIAIMAHPYLVNGTVQIRGKTMSRETYIDGLIEAGLDGIEASYTYAKSSYSGSLTAGQIEDRIRKQYSGRVAVISGGSDYHADARKGVKDPREVGECGITVSYFMENPKLAALLQQGRERET